MIERRALEEIPNVLVEYGSHDPGPQNYALSTVRAWNVIILEPPDEIKDRPMDVLERTVNHMLWKTTCRIRGWGGPEA